MPHGRCSTDRKAWLTLLCYGGRQKTSDSDELLAAPTPYVVLPQTGGGGGEGGLVAATVPLLPIRIVTEPKRDEVSEGAGRAALPAMHVHAGPGAHGAPG